MPYQKFLADGTAVDPPTGTVNFAGATASKSGDVTTLTFAGDIASVAAGSGLTGGGTSGALTLTVGAGDGITVNADDVALASTAGGAGLTYTTGVLAVGAGTCITVNANDVAVSAASLVGTQAALVADANVIGGLPVIHRILVASGADGDVDVTLTHKTRVIDAWIVLKGAGTAGCLVTIKSTGNAISNAVNVAAGGDRARFGVGEIDDANHEIAAAGVLRVSKASTGADFPGAEVYVMGLRVA